MDPNSDARLVGVLIGAALVGIVFGLIPLAFGRKRGRPGLAWTGFWLCAVSGLLFGLIGAVPMAGLMCIVIAVVGSPEKVVTRSGAAPMPKRTAPQNYEL